MYFYYLISRRVENGKSGNKLCVYTCCREWDNAAANETAIIPNTKPFLLFKEIVKLPVWALQQFLSNRNCIGLEMIYSVFMFLLTCSFSFVLYVFQHKLI